MLRSVKMFSTKLLLSWRVVGGKTESRLNLWVFLL